MCIFLVIELLVNEYHHANPNQVHQWVDDKFLLMMFVIVNIVLLMFQDQLQYDSDTAIHPGVLLNDTRK